MANLDFIVVPLGIYIKNHLSFGQRLSQTPLVFSANYFLKDENGNYMNDKIDKKVWIFWAEGRVHGEYEAIETPIGFIPKYEDISNLFRKTLGKSYTSEQYEKQFSIRTEKLLAELDRIQRVYADEKVPEEVMIMFQNQRELLYEARERFKKETISPFDFLIG